jgi:hypothetical protein
LHCIPQDGSLDDDWVLDELFEGCFKINVWMLGFCLSLSLSGHTLLTVKFVGEV